MRIHSTAYTCFCLVPFVSCLLFAVRCPNQKWKTFFARKIACVRLLGLYYDFHCPIRKCNARNKHALRVFRIRSCCANNLVSAKNAIYFRSGCSSLCVNNFHQNGNALFCWPTSKAVNECTDARVRQHTPETAPPGSLVFASFSNYLLSVKARQTRSVSSSDVQPSFFVSTHTKIEFISERGQQ